MQNKRDRQQLFRIAFTPSALDDMQGFRKHEQKIIFDTIEEQLTHQPNVETRHRKPLRPNQVTEWELRIGKYRVFYDVDTDRNAVEVKMVGSKEGNKLCVRGKEYELWEPSRSLHVRERSTRY